MADKKKLSRAEQGEETRRILLETGSRMFGSYGYHGVSVRQLVKEAGVNLSTVNYHFGSKAGLYQAIFDVIVEKRDRIFPTVEVITERLSEAGDDPVRRTECVLWYMRTLVRGMIGDPDHIWPAFMISREMAQPTELFPVLQERFFDPSFESLHTFVGGILPHVSNEETIIVSQSIVGMIVKFLEGRTLIARRMGWNGYQEYGIDMVVDILSKRTVGFLGLPMENIA